MARNRACFSWNCLFLCTTTFSVVFALTLPQGTQKPRQTKFSSSTIDPGVASTTSATDSGIAYYRLINPVTHSTCILMKTDGIVEVKFKLHNLEEQADTFLPAKPTIEGNCNNEDAATMRLEWPGYSLLFSFAKTPGGERWYIDDIELEASEKLPKFHGIGTSPIKLYHRKMLTPTPVGKSFVCQELDIPLEPDEEDHPPPDIHGTLLLRSLQVQPFMYKSENFEEAFGCKPQMSYRDETAPVVVGSTLAVAVLLTISGYGIYRYFRVKNVQYNTME